VGLWHFKGSYISSNHDIHKPTTESYRIYFLKKYKDYYKLYVPFKAQKIFSGILRHLIYSNGHSNSPPELPADDRRVAETQWARWSAAMTVGFYRPPQCTVGKFF